MAVYFLRPMGLAGPVKIGCSKIPKGRLKTYTAWSPFPLELVAVIDGDEALERRFHARFAFLHSHGEWFKGHPELSRVIREITSGTFNVDCLPEPFDIRPRYKPRRQWTDEQACAHGLRIRAQRAGLYDAVSFESPLWRAYCDCGPREPFDFEKAEMLFRWLEEHAPAPNSKSSRVMRRLLAERATPTADTAA